eukprot:GHVU01187382.1.p1 GENE.GHVU01187382.1~~GHVU01187382.1.p1  ORF type:complete len:121 (-),score=15.46 GHVU01187382.1:324-686(-)
MRSTNADTEDRSTAGGGRRRLAAACLTACLRGPDGIGSELTNQSDAIDRQLVGLSSQPTATAATGRTSSLSCGLVAAAEGPSAAAAAPALSSSAAGSSPSVFSSFCPARPFSELPFARDS